MKFSVDASSPFNPWVGIVAVLLAMEADFTFVLEEDNNPFFFLFAFLDVASFSCSFSKSFRQTRGMREGSLRYRVYKSYCFCVHLPLVFLSFTLF